MKQFLFAMVTMTLFPTAHALGIPYLTVSGQEALQDHQINQYADEENPPQGYVVQLPAGYEFIAANVDSGGNSICGVSAFDYKKQAIKIDGFYIETDGATCIVTLTIYDKKTKKNLEVRYAIEQTGT